MSATWSSSPNQDDGVSENRAALSDASSPSEHSLVLQRCCSECQCVDNPECSVQSVEPEPPDGELPSLEEIHRLFLASLLPDNDAVTEQTTGDQVKCRKKRGSKHSEDRLSSTKTNISRIMTPSDHSFFRTPLKLQRRIVVRAPIRRKISSASDARDFACRRFLLDLNACAMRAYHKLLAVAPEHDYCAIPTPPTAMPNSAPNHGAFRKRPSGRTAFHGPTALSSGSWRSPELSQESGKIYHRRDFLKPTALNENANFIQREAVLQNCLSGGTNQHRSSLTTHNAEYSVMSHIETPAGGMANQDQRHSELGGTFVETEVGNEPLPQPSEPDHADNGAPGSSSGGEQVPGPRKSASRKEKSAEVHRCSSCDTVFRTQQSLTVHMRRHTGERPFRCHLCPGAFMSWQVLYYHMLRHSSNRPWKCDLCSKAYVKKHFLDVHMRHGHKRESLYKCNLCPQAFAVATSLEIHKRTHTTEEKLSLCRVCLATFPDRNTLLQHALANHSNVRPFICDQCGKSFALPSALKNHSRVHRRKMSTITTDQQGSSSDMESSPLPTVSPEPSQQL